jgi:FkbH-like protein
MHMSASCFADSDLQRITQLINKTNQFNLTSVRMTQDEVIAVQQDDKYQTFQFRLKDSFGDMGIIAVVIASYHGAEWDIDSWLMSCRVLGRKVEQGILSCIVAKARTAGISTIRASFIPTTKNSMVKDHYDKLGFHLEKAQSDGCRYYKATVADINIDEIPISMHFPNDTSQLCRTIENVPEPGLPKEVA